ncbi:MAG: hypothetical protein LBT09_15450, partial [Planctomycetaceae bacterium]|nr:hypothetical protein [Planctomycetaceae bacterium]
MSTQFHKFLSFTLIYYGLFCGILLAVVLADESPQKSEQTVAVRDEPKQEKQGSSNQSQEKKEQ